MSPERLEHLLGLVGPLIQKKEANPRKAIPAIKQLMLTMRFLASGDHKSSYPTYFEWEKKV